MTSRMSTIYKLGALWGLLTLFLGCGTEIGNGWRADDGVSNRDDDKQQASAQDGSSKDQADNYAGEGGPDAGDQANGDHANNAEPEDVAKLPGSEFDILYLFVECSSPFASDIAREDYLITAEDEELYILWEEDAWQVRAQRDGDTILTVTPEEDQLVLSRNGQVLKSPYQCRDIEETVIVDEESGLITTESELQTNDGLLFTLAWDLNPEENRLVDFRIYHEDNTEADFTVTSPEEAL